MPGRPWWEEAVVYQVYPRSFCDTDGDGVGDLEGVRGKLDHLAWLGVGAIWLSPFYRSPMADFGYDVADYCDVDPLFGTLDDFDHLVADAHARGIKVIVDWVPNHTSDRHPWFLASRSSRDDPKRSWYVWRDGPGGGPPDPPPNNWRSAFPGVGRRERPPAWTWDDATGQWYLHLFLPEQPDLDWANPEVRAAMAGVLRFWMARGVDGFRVDVVQALGKDPSLPDVPDHLQPPSGTNDRPETHPILAELRRVVDGFDPGPAPRMMVGEVYLPTARQVADYHGTPERPELHLAFNFSPLFAPWDADEWRVRIDEVRTLIEARPAWPTWVLSNHDNPRHRTRYGSEARARAAAVLLLCLRGTPFLYAGEELGLDDAEVPPERRVDPGHRDGCRAPIPWDATPAHGWASTEPWLPWPPGADAGTDAATQRDDPSSMLQLYRRLLAARRASPALRSGTFAWLHSPAGTLAWLRTAEGGDATGSHPATGPGAADRAGDRRAVLIDVAGAGATVELPPGGWRCEVHSLDAGATSTVRGSYRLDPGAAVVLAPA
ncbi:MAG TPA: alpha-amylase family glycosyl hydrolase [Acidimicrobiales bacterium]|nr:alpha-amylase family glycosyl hydrolase [Acidimicrobiales bacterium]